MATAGIVCSPYGMACTECNHPLIAPKWSGYVSKHEVHHFWSCDNCGHEIELAVNPRIDAASKPSNRSELVRSRSSHKHALRYWTAFLKCGSISSNARLKEVERENERI